MIAAARRAAFTLIEMMIVVVIIAILSAVAVPNFLKAQERARQARQAKDHPAAAPAPKAEAEVRLPQNAVWPAIEKLTLHAKAQVRYERRGAGVLTQTETAVTGETVFRLPATSARLPIVIQIPIPIGNLELRNIQLKQGDKPVELPIISQSAALCWILESPEPGLYTVAYSYDALGNDTLAFRLPAASRLLALDASIDLGGAAGSSVPPDSLRPTSVAPDTVRWQMGEVVSDRSLVVEIPAAASPIARVMLLCRLMGLAVLLFGFGFWYFAEEWRPGLLKDFRLGHFFFVAVTYSLFFVIFAVLTFNELLGVYASLALAALVALPLLLVHVARYTDWPFAIRRVLPLALGTLAIVLNGVYGGENRDILYLGAFVVVIGYTTVSFPRWSRARNLHLAERQAGFTARIDALRKRLSHDLDPALETLAVQREQPAVKSLFKARESFSIPGIGVLGEFPSMLANAERELDSMLLQVEGIREARRDRRSAEGAGAHCMACGAANGEGRFCPECGAPRVRLIACLACDQTVTIPMHVVDKEKCAAPLRCPRCASPMDLAPPATAKP